MNKYFFFAAIWLLSVLQPGLPRSPEFSGVDPDIVDSIFGDSMDTARYGNDEEEFEEIPITLIPEDDGCKVMETPRTEQKKYEELNKIEVVVETENRKCDFYTKTQGFECVPYYQCDSDGTIITDGYGLIDVRFGGESEQVSPEFAVLDYSNMMCPGSLDVCCKDSEHEPVTNEPLIKPDPEPQPDPEPKPCGETKGYVETDCVPDAQKNETEADDGKSGDSFQPKCGRRNVGGIGIRIQNYQEGEAQFGEWPHICIILQVVEQSNGYGATEEVKQFVGGSSLIAPGAILTAAHKVFDYRDDPSSLLVRCGEWDTQTDSEPLKHQDRKVKEIFIHPQYNRRNLGHTAAILILESDFVLHKHIDTMCLPDIDENFDTESECFVKGWGKDEWNGGDWQVVLKNVDVPMVSRDVCQQKLKGTKLGRRFRLDKSFVCAGGIEGKDACKGDGGGPLVCPIKNDPEGRYVQVGIVAWGIGCGDPIPAAYTSVSHIGCWIDYTLKCHFQENYEWRYDHAACSSWLDRLPETARSCPDLRWPLGSFTPAPLIDSPGGY